MSDSGGFIPDPAGLSRGKPAFIKDLNEVRRGRIAEYAEKFFDATFTADARPWRVRCEVALPCATQNELDADDARLLLKNGVQAVCEGANMPTTLDGVRTFADAGILYAPDKAANANAGGVAVFGLEQSQNALRISWRSTEVDARLKAIMSEIHRQCVQHGAGSGPAVDYVKGATSAVSSKSPMPWSPTAPSEPDAGRIGRILLRAQLSFLAAAVEATVTTGCKKLK